MYSKLKRRLVSIFLMLTFVLIMLAAIVQPVQASFPSDNPTEERHIVDFGEATDFPEDLDELYSFIEEKHRGYDFSEYGCEKYSDFSKPYLDWGMIDLIMGKMDDDQGTHMVYINSKDLAEIFAIGGVEFVDQGKLVISENDLFAILILSFFMGDEPMMVCSLHDGEPTLYRNASWIAEMLEMYVQEY